MDTVKTLARAWPIHLVVLVVSIVSIVSQLIGVRAIPIGIGTILLLPLLLAFPFTLLPNPHVVSDTGRLIRPRMAAAASPLIVVAVPGVVGTYVGSAAIADLAQRVPS